jgi:hypothetical protein
VVASVVAAPASAAWSELDNSVPFLTANTDFDTVVFDGSIYTASGWTDGVGAYGLAVTKSPVAGPQTVDYSEAFSPYSQPLDPMGGYVTAANLIVDHGQLCMVTARDPFPEPFSDYVLHSYCRSGGTWSLVGSPTPVADLSPNAQPYFCLSASSSSPQMAFATLDGSTASFRSARFDGDRWVPTGDLIDSFAASPYFPPKCATALIAGQPYLATSPSQWVSGTVKVSAFGVGHWHSVGDSLAPPAGREIADFDLASFGDRPAVAWASGASPLDQSPARTDDALFYSVQDSTGHWQQLGHDLNGPGTTINSVSAKSVNGRPVVVWSSISPPANDGDFSSAAMRAVTGPGPADPTAPWTESTDVDGSIGTPPSATRYRVELTSLGDQPVVSYSYVEPSPRDQYPVGLIVGDPIAVATTPTVPPRALGVQASGTSLTPLPPQAKPKKKLKKKRVCKRSKRTHRVSCRHVVVKRRK